MTSLRSFTLLLCGTAVLCTLFSRLFPDSRIGRQGRLILPCVFLCVMLAPLVQAVRGGTWQWQPSAAAVSDGAALTARIRAQTVRQTEELLLRMVDQALESYGLSAKKVTADMDIAADGSISMGQITVYVDARTAVRSVAVAQIASARLGAPVTVALWEEGEG